MIKGMKVFTMICLQVSNPLHCLNKLTSSDPSALSLWWFLNKVSSFGVTSGDMEVMMSGLTLEKRTKASIGRYIESREARSINLITGDTTQLRIS